MRVVVNAKKQLMTIYKNDEVFKTFPVSTSKFGIGNKIGSRKTPLGKHKISAKFGKNAPEGSIFNGSRNTGEIISQNEDFYKGQDLITTRILQLEGLEEGINKGDGIDSAKRYIWIHGTTQESMIGKPASQGCIRMKNKDIIIFFDIVRVGTKVEITK
ncbi:MAG: L,D-transpeptidase [Candidatus Cloacimonetes bacterium]|nr:L,D-transpeptidase [Candidatus Cloacimonadota bacterium]